MSGISYEPPTGQPLGTNKTFQICTAIVIPLLRLFTKRQWSGMENIPKSGPAIVASNHVSYADVIFLAQFLYENGRAPRFIGKRSVFDVPIIGRIVLAAGQIPVDRESGDANKALDHAVAALKAGHLVGIYPEGTLTRDQNLWPMVAKTGLARLAIITRNPIIPVAAWGTAKVLPRYGKIPHLFPRTKVTYVAGTPIDMSAWYGKEEDPQALAEATAHVMKILTAMVASIRGENPPSEVFDPHTSDLPRTGNFKKAKKK
ncbi:MAG: 1-acyl-sn-glycerol-3-phosphate acyltransferase [Streptomycetaceae bacterium]|nr:MAG: 1-acyl-sn-glycerol-3-phosphate acyltransferase [Streptomycetaceae bacterium]